MIQEVDNMRFIIENACQKKSDICCHKQKQNNDNQRRYILAALRYVRD